MSAYKVGFPTGGSRVWWPSYQDALMPAHLDRRDATTEEAALMEKVIWDKATEAEVAELRRLIEIDKKGPPAKQPTAQD